MRPQAGPATITSTMLIMITGIGRRDRLAKEKDRVVEPLDIQLFEFSLDGWEMQGRASEARSPWLVVGGWWLVVVSGLASLAGLTRFARGVIWVSGKNQPIEANFMADLPLIVWDTNDLGLTESDVCLPDRRVARRLSRRDGCATVLDCFQWAVGLHRCVTRFATGGLPHCRRRPFLTRSK
jgi:hypothetical protein